MWCGCVCVCSDSRTPHWLAAAVWKWFEKNGIKTQPIKDKIDDLIVKTLLAVEPQISTNMQVHSIHTDPQ